MRKFSKEEIENARKTYCKGSLINKIDPKDVKIVPIDSETIERINRRALVSIRSHDSQKDIYGEHVFRY